MSARLAGGATLVGLLAVLLVAASDNVAISALAIGLSALTACLVAVGPTRLGYLMVLAAVVTAPMDGQLLSPGTVSATDVLLVLGFFLMLPVLIRRSPSLPSLFVLGATILVIVSLLAATNAGDEPLGYVRVSRLVAGVIAVPVAFMVWRPDRSTIRALCWSYVAGQSISLVQAVATDLPAGARFMGLSSHPNVFGACSVICLGLLYFLAADRSSRARLAITILASAHTVGLAMSGSRGALVALAVVVAVIAVRELSGWLWSVLAIVLAAAMIAPASILAVLGEESAVGRLLNPEASRNATGAGLARERLLSRGVEEFLDAPLTGHGFDGVYTFYYHDGFLEIAVAAGILAAMGYALIVLSVLQTLTSPLPTRRLGYAALGYFVTALAIPTIWDRFAWVPMAIVLAARMATPHEESPHHEAAMAHAR